MTTPINVPVTFPGVTDSQGAMLALAQAVAGLANNVSTLGQKQGEQAAKTREADQAQGNASQNAIAFTQRISSVANAVQNLTSRLGSHDGTAGLVGSVAGTTAQFASMGAALGPQGAVIGGIVGLTAAVVELANSQNTATDRAHALQEAQQQLAHSVHETTTQMAAELIADENLYRQHAESVSSFWTVVTGSSARALQQMQQDRAMIARDQQRLSEEADREAREGPNGLGGLGPAPLSPLGQGHLPTADDVTRLTGRGNAGSPHRGGGPSADERADAALAGVRAQIDELESGPLAGIEQQTNDLEASFTTAWNAAADGSAQYGQALQEVIDQLRATQEAQEETQRATTAAADEEARHTTELANLKAHYREVDEHAQTEADSQRHKSMQAALREQEQTKAKVEQEAQTRVQEGQQATGAIIGNLTNVFTLMAEGQANAAQGAELLLAGFLQYISQRATIEALAQVAQGIGSYPDFGGMALHFAAAAAWGAVAVATGVGSAALTSDAQGQAAAAASQAQQKPAEPQHSAGDKGGGGNSTVVINWNSPVPMTSQQAQAAVRPLRRYLGQSEQRFPTG